MNQQIIEAGYNPFEANYIAYAMIHKVNTKVLLEENQNLLPW
jgi:hypothetical protein